MALEPPVKKRRRHDFFTVDGLAPPAEGEGPCPPDMSPGPIEEGPEFSSQAEATGERAEVSGSPERTPLEPSQSSSGDHSLEIDEEKLRKKRNREEVDGISKAYRRLKGCLADDRDSEQDVEEAFRAMLSFATGCASVRRIAAELIPRYAVFCPGCLEESSRTILHICDWSGDLILQGADTDSLAEETARAAYAGLVELSAAAVTKSSETSSGLGAKSAAVCRNIALYLLHQLHGRALVDADCGGDSKTDGLSSVVDKNPLSASQKLEKMVISSTVNLFHTDPEGMLVTCFDLLESPNLEFRKDGQHFLRQIMAYGRSSVAIQKAKEDAGPSLAAGDSSVAQAEVATLHQEDIAVQGSGKSAPINSNLVTEVIHPRPALERWIVTAVRDFRRSASQEALAESHVLLTDFVKSLRSFTPSDLELDGEELEAIRAAEDERVNVSFASEEVCLDPERSGQGAESENGDVSGVEKFQENGLEGMPSSSDKDEEQLTTREHGRLNGNHHSEAETDDLPPRRERLSGNGVGRGANSTFKSDYRSWDSAMHHSRLRDPKDAGTFASNQGDPWGSPANGGPRKDAVNAIPSPPQPSTPQHSSSPNRQVWYHDGDPAAMDVYAASQHLWVGSVGQGASESSLRFEFEQFGHVDSVTIFRGQDCAVVDYKNVRDAVKARETLQGKLHFGKSLQIRFLDGSTSRGSNGGAPTGASCHVWIGGISSQSAKDELLNDIASAGLKSPRTVLALVSASAILLEFEAAEEAAKVVLHVRQRRKEGGIPVPPPRVLERNVPVRTVGNEFGNRHLWVGRIDPMVREEDLVGAFAQYGELTGWKLLRASSCCFIDFRSCEEAAVAKVQLNGTRFGCQCIQVEFKNNPNRNPPPPHLNSPPHASALLHSPSLQSGGRMAGGHALSSALANLSSKFHMAAGGGNLAPGRNRNFRVAGREVTERVPTNTLWIGLPDCVGPSFMNESELKSLFNMATAGVGGVTKVRSARTSRGPCRFVEFDTVEAAAVALRSVSGRLDASIQIEFSNSAISMQQSENPQFHGFQNSAYGQGPVDDSRRRAFDHHRDRERAISRGTREWEHEREDRHSSTPGNSDEAGTPGNRSLPPGWGGVSDKDYPEDIDRREHRRPYFEPPSDQKEEPVRSDATATRVDSAVYRGSAEYRDSRSYDDSYASSVPGRKPLLERQSSATRPPLPPQPSPVAAPKQPPRLNLDKVPQSGGWSGSSSFDQVSPAAASSAGKTAAASSMGFGGKVERGHGRINTFSQSPVTPAVVKSSRQSSTSLTPVAPISPPHPPPPAGASPPPFSPSAAPSSFPPPSRSPPPPREFASEVPVRRSTFESRVRRGPQPWIGPLCKSGMQYCEVIAYRQESTTCGYEGGLREPTGWPEKLDVTKRADFKSVKNTFNSTSPLQREVCRLFLSPAAQSHDGFDQFVTYLKERDRAGVVKISGGDRIWSRMLYILPWRSRLDSLLEGMRPMLNAA